MDYGRQMPRQFLRALLGLAVVAALLVAPAASAAPGDLDPTFGSGGSIRLLPSNEDISLRAVAVQPDLKIVMAGADSTTNSVIVVRLLPGGALDPGFGAGGIASTSFAGGFGEARAIALQPDGKIVVAGAAKGALGNEFLVARYNNDGSPDAGFGGGDGIQLVPVGPSHDRAEAVAIGPGGHILVTGEADLGSSKESAGVAVLKPEGTPDPAFSEDGTTLLDATGNTSDEGVAIAELADGRILIGDATGAGGGDGFMLVRLLSSGLPDPEFGEGDGIVKTPIPSTGSGRVTDFVLRPDGRIVASGYGFDAPPAESKFAAVGYLANGALDTSFADTGIFTQQVGAGSDSAEVVELTPSGKVLLAGNYDAAPSNASTALMRLDPLGALDPGFGRGGIVTRGVQAPFGEIFQDAALDAEERMVAVSTAYIGGGNTEVVVTRYLGDKVPAQPISVTFNRSPHARMKKVPRKVTAEKLKGFSGTAKDFDGHGLKRVQVALVKRVKAQGKKKPVLRWKKVKGKKKWSFKLKRELPPGRYVVYARAVDGLGLPEAKFSRKLRNRYAFRVLPSR